MATQALVEHLGASHQPPYLLLLSTGGVNGACDGPVPDAHDPRPEGLYALTKYLAEEVVRRTYAGRWGIARLYFPYGPGQAVDRLVPRLAARIRANESISLNRQGRPSISPIYIEDLAHALAWLVDQRAGGVHNVAGPDVLSIGDLATLIAELLGKTPRFVDTGATASDYIALAHPQLCYTPIREGLRVALGQQET